MKKLARLFLIATLILSSGCHKAKNTPPADDRIDKATLLIDREDYESAIEILEDSLANQENTPPEKMNKLRLVLASAYAGRAGVKVENYWDYLVGYDVFVKKPTDDQLPELIPTHRIPEGLKDDEKKQITLLNNYYKDFQRLENKTAKIPIVEKMYRADLNLARKTIQDIDSPSIRLYRSMLTAVVAKSEISDGGIFAKAWTDSNTLVCQNAIPEISEWIVEVLDLVSDGLNDLGHAYPDENESYQSVRKEIRNSIQLTEKIQKQSKTLENVCQLKK